MAVPSTRPFQLVIAALVSLSSAVASAQSDLPSPPLDSRAAFERARIYYESARFDRCVEAFTLLVDQPRGLGGREVSSARTYLAACLIALGKLDRARQRFREAILEDRQMETPDPVVFPQAVVDVFIEVHSSLMDALRRQQDEELRQGRQEAQAKLRLAERERERVRELERLASVETVIRKNERWMTWVPFGVGQFHNQSETLGWVFLSTEVALVATAVTATSIELGLHSRAEGGQAGLDSRDLTATLDAARTVGTVAWLSLAGVVVTGIVEANLSFVPEARLGERKRVLPESLRPAEPANGKDTGVTLMPLVGAGWLGVRGSF